MCFWTYDLAGREQNIRQIKTWGTVENQARDGGRRQVLKMGQLGGGSTEGLVTVGRRLMSECRGDPKTQMEGLSGAVRCGYLREVWGQMGGT